jgi:mRNA interferase RelE/StbE
MYEVRLSSKALKFYSKADVVLLRKLNKCFLYLENNPFESNNIKILTGKLKSLYRYRVGDYRVIYDVNDAQKIVKVLSIKHRKEIYR